MPNVITSLWQPKEIIPKLSLAKELKTAGFAINGDDAKIKCNVLEDSNG